MKGVFFNCLLLLASLHISAQTNNSQIATSIRNDGAAPDPSSILDIQSENQGILVPRMTGENRSAINSPATGLLVYDTDTNSYWYYDGSIWMDIAAGSSGGGSSLIEDMDGDTKIRTESTPDEDLIRIDVDGSESLVISRGRIEFLNSGNSVFIGEKTGQNAGFGNNKNTAIGGYSMMSVGGGEENTAVGYFSLAANMDDGNTAVGFYSLANNTIGSYNVATGYAALSNNTRGDKNTATGNYSLYSNVTGNYNVANGSWSLRNNTSGHNNVGVGRRALSLNTSGNYNIAVGSYSLSSNLTGYDNVAIGNESLKSSTGEENIAIGSKSLFLNTSGNTNTGIGYHAMYYNISGEDNTALGINSLRFNSTGHRNVAIGAYSGSNFENLSNWIALGAGAKCTASNQARVGSEYTTSIGGYVNWTTVSDSRFKDEVKHDVLGLDFINALRPVTYTLSLEKISQFNKERFGANEFITYEQKNVNTRKPITQTGFIAQEVEAAAKKLSYDFSGVDAPKNKDDFYGIRYAEFVVPLVKAVQELSEENKELKEIILKIQAQIE